MKFRASSSLVFEKLQQVLPRELVYVALRRRNAIRAVLSSNNWAKNDYAGPSPDRMKRAVLLRNGYPEGTWVETGTYLGDTTAELAKRAKSVFSLEPEPKLYASAAKRFADAPNVTIMNGTSEDLFPALLERLAGDVSFWLDGHASGGLTFQGSKDTPVVEELHAIGGALSRFQRVSVMVDDLHCFHPSHPESSHYPRVDFLVDWARKHGLVWHIEHNIFIAKR